MSDDVGTIVERIDELEDWRTDLVGKSGDNGKLGAIRKDVASLKGDRSKVVAGILGSILVAGLAIYSAGVKSGARDAELTALKAQNFEQDEEIQQLRLMVLRFVTNPFPSALPAPISNGEPP